MRPYSQQALTLKLGLEAGVVEREKIIAWADGVLNDYDYDDDVANLALSKATTKKDLMTLLGKVIDTADVMVAMRPVLGRMSSALQQDRARAHDFADFLERFWTQHNHDLPEEMVFMSCIGDSFQLAKKGVYGDWEELTDQLIEDLASFKTE